MSGAGPPAVAAARKDYDPPLAPSGAYFDILFSPSGAVVGAGTANDKIVLWVRDVTQPTPVENHPVLVCIYTRSGLIASHDVDVSAGGNPYSFTADGKPSEE